MLGGQLEALSRQRKGIACVLSLQVDGIGRARVFELYGYEATWLDNLRFTGPGKRELCFSSISKVFHDGAWPNLLEAIN